MSAAVITRATGRVVELKLNRPDVGNALDLTLVEELLQALDAVDPDTCDTVVFLGEGKGFCGGLNLAQLDKETDATLFYLLVRIETLLQKIAAMSQETVAMAHRFAFGAGADVFAACRRRIAAPGTKFAFPGVRFGIALGTGRLARRVGPDAARRRALRDGAYPLDEALRSGLAEEQRAVDDWPALIEEMSSVQSSLDARMAQIVADRLNPGKDDEDMAALESQRQRARSEGSHRQLRSLGRRSPQTMMRPANIKMQTVARTTHGGS